jgi:hypothetical protein
MDRTNDSVEIITASTRLGNLGRQGIFKSGTMNGRCPTHEDQHRHGQAAIGSHT